MTEYDDFHAWLERCPLQFERLSEEEGGQFDLRFHSNTFNYEEVEYCDGYEYKVGKMLETTDEKWLT